MKINFIKLNPVENMTIFVKDYLPRDKHMTIANKLMDYNNIHGEQVGFMEEPRSIKGKSLNTLRLQMMGGEFCGNATRSLAAYMVYENHPSINKIDDNKYSVNLEVSGSEELLTCIVSKTHKDYILRSRIAMPLPERVTTINVNSLAVTRVDFQGINHFIVDSAKVEDKDEFYNHIKRYMDKEDYDAFGIMYYDAEEDLMKPLVYVRMTNTRFWERSCASGTSAFGIAKAVKDKGNTNIKVKQPGGILEVHVKLEDGEVKEILLDGEVEIVAEGRVNIDAGF